MTAYYYDVVVIGMDIGPLAAGALLAKRGFRVLVAGQNAPKDRYTCFNYQFTRRPFVLTGGESPALRRIVAELGMGQLFQHAVEHPDPVCQLILPKVRVNLHRSPDMLEREVRRELPDADHRIREALEHLGRINGEIDKLFSHEFVLPPETFFEKRELTRVEVQNPFRTAHFLGTRPGDAALPEIFSLPVRFGTADAHPLAPLVFYRQLGAWLFNCAYLEGGRDGLSALLLDQIAGQGGDVQLRQRVSEITVGRGRVTGVRIAGKEEMAGCRVVLSHLTPRELSVLMQPKSWTKRFHAMVAASPDPALRYAVNLGLDREVIPEGLALTTFVSWGKRMGESLLRIEQVPQVDKEKAALNVSCLVPPERQEEIASGALRDAILDTMQVLFPYFFNHLKVIHSPYDGFGPIDLTGKAKGDVPPRPHPEEIPKWLLRPPPKEGVLGVGAMPHRTGIKGLLLSGDQVVSGLDTEGELIAAWGAARIAGRMDPRRERLVRSMRAKVEM